MIEEIFSAKSPFDIGIDDIYLSDVRAEHIIRGHRDMSRVFHLVIKQAIERTTQIYTSSYDHKRLQFVSEKTTTKGGNPMMIVVERKGVRGEVITATPKSNVTGQLMWESSNNIHTHYDADVDILYVSRGAVGAAIAEEVDGILYRKDEDTNIAYGVTVFDLRRRWSEKREEIESAVAEFLGLMKSEVSTRIKFAF